MRPLAVAALVLALAAVPGARGADEQRDCSYDPPPAPSPRIVRGTFDALPYNVLLPSDYASTTIRYPVLYLLHGGEYNENTWLYQSDIEELTAPLTGDKGVIVVMPDGGPFGEYTDWEVGDQQWETYHLRRLLPFVEKTFRIKRGRQWRAVAGFSYGGEGAMNYATRQPDLFGIAGSFSGLVHPDAYRSAYTGPSPVTDAKGRGAPGPATATPAPRKYQPPTDNGSGCDRSDGSSAFGDPVSNEIARRSHDPTDLAFSLKDTAVWVGAGTGVPCPGEPDTPDKSVTGPLEPPLRKLAQDFDAALTAAKVEHTLDIDGCGLHDMINGQRQLHAFWPLMAAAFGKPPARPATFAIRRSEPAFTVYGWTFVADPKRAREFLEVTAAGRRGVTLAGSGTATVTTGRLFAPGRRVRIGGALPRAVKAGRSGRIRFRVDLGPAHATQQFTPGAEQEPFVRRRVTFTQARQRDLRPARHRAG